MKRKSLCLLVVGATALVPLASTAQSRSALEEIIVTAQKREEAIQDVPVALTALGTDNLEKLGINNIIDLQGSKVPSLQVAPYAGRPGQLLIAMRGIAASDPLQLTAEPSNALYIDGVYIARQVGIDTDLFDLERMEILRGPQGTLFGRNAMGGALSLITQKPTGEFGFKQLLEGSDLDVYRSKTVINTPSIGGLSARFDYLRGWTDGWIKNPMAGQKDFNWQEKEGYRIALQLQATDALTADYAYDYLESDYTQNLNVLEAKPATSPLQTPVLRGRQERAWIGMAFPTSYYEAKGHNLTLTWDINDSLAFKSISSYRELLEDNYSPQAGAAAFVPANIFGPSQTFPLSGSVSTALTEQEQWSQEFQLIGDTEQLEWQAGILYFHEEGSFAANGGFNIGYLGGVGPMGVGSTPVGIEPFWLTTPTVTEIDTDSLGIYGQATWTPQILDQRLHLTLGLRYGRDEKTAIRTRQSGQPVNFSATPTEERVDPALTLAFDLADSVSAYVRYSTAYRGGGVSVREVGRFSPYAEEELETVELGLKSEFWDRRARLNAALFYNELDGMQMPFQQTTGCPGVCSQANTIIANLDRTARLSGFELDGSLLLLDGLTLTFAYTHLDDDMPLAVNPETPTAAREEIYRPQAPRHAWSVSLDYEFLPFSFGTLDAHIDVSDTSSYCLTVRGCEDDIISTGPITGVQGGKDNRVVNARLTLSDIPMGGVGNLKAALWGKNLTDAESRLFGFTAPGALTNTSVVHFSDPRSVGMTLTYEY
jgi:iron complex outermembrane receptor protein